MTGVASSTRKSDTSSPAPVLLLCQDWARFECVEDEACELAFEAADRFAPAFAFGLLAFQVGASGGMDARLGDRDPVQRAVELAVAAAVEPVATNAA